MLERANTLRGLRRSALLKLHALDVALFDHVLRELEHAPKAPLGEVVDHVTVGHVGPTSEYFADEGVPFLRTGNLGDGVIVRKDLRYITPEFHSRLRKSELRSGDLLISRVVSDSVRTAVVPDDLDGANCANVIVVRPGSRMSAAFLGSLIRHPLSQAALLGRRVGSAQSVVNTRVLQQWTVPIPSTSTLATFEEQSAALNEAERSSRASAVQIDELFASLQQRAFRGDL